MLRFRNLAASAVVCVVAATGASASVASTAAPAARVTMPNVVGLRMDRATALLHRRGLRVNEECSGLFGCINKANWWICTQSPRPGARVAQYSVVMIYGRRSMGDC